jgi:hypothetical protein
MKNLKYIIIPIFITLLGAKCKEKEYIGCFSPIRESVFEAGTIKYELKNPLSIGDTIRVWSTIPKTQIDTKKNTPFTFKEKDYFGTSFRINKLNEPRLLPSDLIRANKDFIIINKKGRCFFPATDTAGIAYNFDYFEGVSDMELEFFIIPQKKGLYMMANWYLQAETINCERLDMDLIVAPGTVQNQQWFYNWCPSCGMSAEEASKIVVFRVE